MNRYFIELAYDGSEYHGWQLQPDAITVQEVLQKCVSTLLGQPTDVVGAGRTDAGVHARHMVAHFNTEQNVDTAQLEERLNRMLPQDISIYCIYPVVPDAHARYTAISRTYHYFIHEQKLPFHRQYSWRQWGKPLDFDLMNQAAQCLFNYIDFTSFSKMHTDVKTNNCRIMKAEWKPLGEGRWVFEIQADRFLRNMVRAIVGTLIEVGRHKLSVADFCQIIEQKNRCSAGMSVPGYALFLVKVEYPDGVKLNKE